MKTLQNNFTTPKQSKRLLELGVPVWTADGLQTYRGIKFLEKPQYDNPSPCWSVGRLIEIFELCTGRQFIRRMDRPLVEDVKCRIAFYIFHHKFDFSKLED